MNSCGVIYDGGADWGVVYFENEAKFAPKVIKEIKPPASKICPEVYIPKKSFSSFFRPLLLILSSGFIGISLFGIMFLFWPVLVQEVRYQLILKHQSTASSEKISGFPAGDAWSPVNTTFSIVVPKIDAKAAIIANIDPSTETNYMEALKTGVAQAAGTCFPGMDCTMYLFAHSAGSAITASRYNAVFYLLRKLESGDQVIVYYYGKKFLYEVTGKEIVTEKDTHYITEVGKEERLILQTCDPPGTTINRLLVFARPKLVEYLK